MKKLLYLLLILPLFVACSKDDDKTDSNNGGNGNNTETIDKNLIGKWKVDYSKTIRPALYIENEAELKEAKEQYFDSDWFKIGLNVLSDSPSIEEYLGNYGEPNVIPKSGMFDNEEVWIEIKYNNTILVYYGGYIHPKTISYKIEGDKMIWREGNGYNWKTTKYYFEGTSLVMELVKIKRYNPTEVYRISKYSKIAE